MPLPAAPPPPPPAARDPARDPCDLVRLHLACLYHEGAAQRLLERFGSPRRVFEAPREMVLEVTGATPALLERLAAPGLARAARDEVRRAAAGGARLVAQGDEGYPEALAALPGMPLLLYVRGSPAALSAPGVAVVGSRRPTPYGLRQARRFAGALARRGLAVVSGLAAGIDGEAHRAALDAGGVTVAVLGSGLDRIYPREHAELARRIAGGGGTLASELPLDAAPKSFHFPMRNRILSGLGAAVLVVEAGERSGSLITVSHALEQGKRVYAVPGRVDQPEARGCLRLLADGAEPAIDPEDVLPELATPDPENAAPGGAKGPGAPAPVAPRPLPGPLGPRLDALFAEEDSWHPDLISERLAAPPAQVLAELSELALTGRLERLPGGCYALARGP